MVEDKKPVVKTKYTFKKSLLGLDFINSMDDDGKRGINSSVHMAANASISPKMSYKKIVMLPLKKFKELIKQFKEQTGLDEVFLE